MSYKVTVVLPVYNGEKYLIEALDSLASQSYKNFEVVAVDDESRDGSLELLRNYSRLPMRVLTRKNGGIGAALRTGCASATTELIGRMDQDDIALPDRLENQVSYLEEHPEIGVLGGAVIEIDPSGRELGLLQFPADPDYIKKRLIARNLFSHPTVMFRKTVYDQSGGYAEARNITEDYDLWLRMVAITKMSNLQVSILKYRKHAASATNAKTKMYQWQGMETRCRALAAGTYPWWAAVHLLLPWLTYILPDAVVSRVRGFLMLLSGRVVK